MRIRLYPKCTANCKYVDDWCRIRRLNEKTEAKLIYRDKCFSEIKELLQCGGIIALRKIENDVSPFQVIGFYGNSINDVYYMQLGRGRSRFSNIGRMYLSVHKDGVVFLNDWYVENPSNGYGRFFLKSVMDYLRRQGYKKIVGQICPCDFDHEPMLRHLYTELGFEIIDCKDYRSIRCDLQQETSERKTRTDIAQWIQMLEELGDNGRIPAELGISKEEFINISRNPLFQRDLIDTVQELAKKHEYAKYSDF